MRIQLAVIASVRDTPALSPEGDIDLAFAHLCAQHADYCSYFRESTRAGRMVILDNGIMELGTAVDETLLLDVAREIRPALMTPPEVLGNGAATMSLTREFIARMPTLMLPEATRLLGVVHGRTWEEWLQHYRTFHDDLDAIARIGIPYHLTFDVPGLEGAQFATDWERMLETRVRVCELLDEAGLNKKPVHLLGCIDAVELRRQSRLHWVNSNDSSTAYVAAQHGQRYDEVLGIQSHKLKIDMMSSLEADRLPLFHHNVRVIRGFATRIVDEEAK